MPIAIGQYTITDFNDFVVAELSNSVTALSTDSSGNTSYTGSGTKLTVKQGSTLFTYVSSNPVNGQFTFTHSEKGIVFSSVSGAGTSTANIADYSTMFADNATVTFSIIAVNNSGESVPIEKVQSLSKTKQGEKGISVVLTPNSNTVRYGTDNADKTGTVTLTPTIYNSPFYTNYRGYYVDGSISGSTGNLASFNLPSNPAIGAKKTVKVNIVKNVDQLAKYADWKDTSKWLINNGVGTIEWDSTENAIKFSTGTWWVIDTFLPIDTTKKWFIEANIKSTGAGNLYLGTISYDASKSSLTGHPGAFDYFGLAGTSSNNAWTTYCNTQIGGVPRTGVNSTVSDMTAWHTGTVYAKILVITNYSNQSGVTWLKDLKLYYVDEGTAVTSDTVDIFAIQDGAKTVNGFLTNASHVVSADSSGTVSSFTGAGGTYKVYVGSTDVTESCSFSLSTSSGVTTTISNTTGTKGVYSVTAMSADVGTATYQAVIPAATAASAADITLTAVFSISKSKQGDTGGKGDPGNAGLDAVTGYLTNENVSVTTEWNGNSYSLIGTGGTFKVFSGITDKTTQSTFSISGGTDNGTNWTKTQNGLTLTVEETTGVYSLSGASWNSDFETFTLTATYGTVSISKVFKISKTKQGIQGPGTVFRGGYAIGATYYCNEFRKDVVQSGSSYYLTNNILKDGLTTWAAATNTTDWKPFSKLNNVATELLLTDNSVVKTAINIGTNTFGTSSSAGNIVLYGGNAYPYISLGQSTIGYSNSGFFLGSTFSSGSTAYLFSIGDSNTYIRWTGTALQIKGSIDITGGNAATQTYASTQASNAQTAAISAAATDATNKVNAIQIGGRNLAAGTSTGTGWTASGIGATGYAFTPSTREFKIFSGQTYEAAFITSPYYTIPGGVEVTLSFYGKQTSANINDVDLFILPDEYVALGLLNASYTESTDWTYTYVTFTTPSTWGTGTPVKIRFDHNGTDPMVSNSGIYVKDVKLEYGNKPSAWSKPYEDTEETIFTDSTGKVVKAPNASTSGLYIGDTHLGYYSNSAWKTYMSNTGKFYLIGDGANSLSWDGTQLLIRGTIDVVQGGTVGGWKVGEKTLYSADNRLELSGTDNYIKLYDDNDTLKFWANGATALPSIAGSIIYKTFNVNNVQNTSTNNVGDTTTPVKAYIDPASNSVTLSAANAGPYTIKYNWTRPSTASKVFANGEAYASGSVRLELWRNGAFFKASGSISVNTSGTLYYNGDNGGLTQASVTENTLILLDDGSTKFVKDIIAGDIIRTWDWTKINKKLGSSAVLSIKSRNVDHVYKVVTESGKTVEVSESHGFWLDGNTEINVTKIIPGFDSIYVIDDIGQTIKLEKVIEVSKIESDSKVYTLSVDKTNNYISNDILSHNINYGEGWVFGSNQSIFPASNTFVIDSILETGYTYTIRLAVTYNTNSDDTSSYANTTLTGDSNSSASFYFGVSNTTNAVIILPANTGVLINGGGFRAINDAQSYLEVAKGIAVGPTYGTKIVGNMLVDGILTADSKTIGYPAAIKAFAQIQGDSSNDGNNTVVGYGISSASIDSTSPYGITLTLTSAVTSSAVVVATYMHDKYFIRLGGTIGSTINLYLIDTGGNYIDFDALSGIIHVVVIDK